MSLKKIGLIVNSVGIGGDLKVISKTNFPNERFALNKEIIIDGLSYLILKKRDKANAIILHLEGVDDMNQAERLKTKDIWQEVELREGYFFLDDIQGFEVVDQKQQKYGQIDNYQEINGLFYLVIGRYLLPYIKSTFVEKIDFENRTLLISDLATGIFK